VLTPSVALTVYKYINSHFYDDALLLLMIVIFVLLRDSLRPLGRSQFKIIPI
jgi:hypothetical protein